MALREKIIILGVILGVCIGIDQATKQIAVQTLKGIEPQHFVGDLFRLEYAENTGAFLGLASTWPESARFLLLTVFSSAVLAFLAIFLLWKRDLDRYETVAYGLILSGGVSNMIDRLAVGAVVDFMNMGIGSLRTGIFNVADMAIMAGLFAVLLHPVFCRSSEGSAETPSEAVPTETPGAPYPPKRSGTEG